MGAQRRMEMTMDDDVGRVLLLLHERWKQHRDQPDLMRKSLMRAIPGLRREKAGEFAEKIVNIVDDGGTWNACTLAGTGARATNARIASRGTQPTLSAPPSRHAQTVSLSSSLTR